MKRLIHIWFRHGDVIFESSRNRCIHFVDHTEGSITVFYRIYNDTYRKQIINLIQCLVLIDHLFINTEEMLHPSVDLSLDPRVFDVLGDLLHDLLDELLPLRLPGVDLVHQIIEHLRLGVLEG